MAVAPRAGSGCTCPVPPGEMEDCERLDQTCPVHGWEPRRSIAGRRADDRGEPPARLTVDELVAPPRIPAGVRAAIGDDVADSIERAARGETLTGWPVFAAANHEWSVIAKSGTDDDPVVDVSISTRWANEIPPIVESLLGSVERGEAIEILIARRPA